MLLDPLFIFHLQLGYLGSCSRHRGGTMGRSPALLVPSAWARPSTRGWCVVGPLKRTETLAILQAWLPIVTLNSLFALITFVMGTITARAGGHIGVATINIGGQLEAITWNTSQGFGTALAAFVPRTMRQESRTASSPLFGSASP